jgi:hypothetical protein
MKIANARIEDNQFAFELTHEGARDLFATQTAMLQILLQERATLLAQNRLLFDLVAELRHEDVQDVQDRFENFQREQFQKLFSELDQLLSKSQT